MGKGPLGPLKLHLVAKVQFWHFATGQTEVFLYKATLPSPSVEKCDQNGSALVRVPSTP